MPGAGGGVFLDAFHQGRLLDAEQCEQLLHAMSGGRLAFDPGYLAPVEPRSILVRMLNNLKGAHLRAQDVPGALRAVERLLLLDTDLHEERRDMGLMLAHLGRDAEAIDALQAYLDGWPDAPDRERIEATIATLAG